MVRLAGAVVAAVLLGIGAAAADGEEAIATVKFTCDDSKSIDATFYSDKVHLVLSDGRTLDVPQAMSASGARYANADESFVFWNVGNTAFITEGDPDVQTYANCVEQKS